MRPACFDRCDRAVQSGVEQNCHGKGIETWKICALGDDMGDVDRHGLCRLQYRQDLHGLKPVYKQELVFSRIEG